MRTAGVLVKCRLRTTSRAGFEKIEAAMSERRHGEQTDDESANMKD
jgi:hypothetical protein